MGFDKFKAEMNDINKWAIVGNVFTCVFVGVVFIVTRSPYSFLLLVLLTIIKNKK